MFIIARELGVGISFEEIRGSRRRRSKDGEVAPEVIDQLTLKDVLEEKYLQVKQYQLNIE